MGGGEVGVENAYEHGEVEPGKRKELVEMDLS